MPLRRQRRQYQQLNEFERGRVIGLREGGLSFHAARKCGRWAVVDEVTRSEERRVGKEC